MNPYTLLLKSHRRPPTQYYDPSLESPQTFPPEDSWNISKQEPKEEESINSFIPCRIKGQSDPNQEKFQYHLEENQNDSEWKQHNMILMYLVKNFTMVAIEASRYLKI